MFNTLLVEDNVEFRQELADILLAHFPMIGVEEAGDAADALSKVEYQRPDLIFMDIKLPGENGLETTRQIKQVYAYIVIVILTSYDIPEYRQQAFKNGADCFISKGQVSFLADILARVEGTMALRH
jgi:DNA-binding NarL/FixJ family response regulator